jgi:hypothetical protein
MDYSIKFINHGNTIVSLVLYRNLATVGIKLGGGMFVNFRVWWFHQP